MRRGTAGKATRRLAAAPHQVKQLPSREIAQLALERGASDYLVKTTDLSTLRSSIELCLARMEAGNVSWWKRFFG